MTFEPTGERSASEDAGCRVLLRVQCDDRPSTFKPMPAHAGLLLAPGVTRLTDWRNLAHEHGIACMLEEDWRAAARLGMDGVLLRDHSQLAAARRALGPDAIIGACVRAQRHDAMLAGEAGADYVLVGSPDQPICEELLEFVEWWQAMTVLPVAVAGPFDDDRLAGLKAAGADFVLIDLAVIDAGLQASLARIFA